MKKNGKAAYILVFVLLAGGASGLWWWSYSRTHVSTDDAFINSHTFTVSPKISGKVSHVFVEDNQKVHKGDLLVELDPADFEVRVREAEANVDLAKNETRGGYALIEAAKAGVTQAGATLDQSLLDFERAQSLYAIKVISKEQFDKFATEHKVAAAKAVEAGQKLKSEEANLGLTQKGGRDASIAQKEAQLAQAKLNLSYTKIYAPSDGYVTKKNIETGNYVQPGQPLLHVVNLDTVWITANFKESQLTDVKPGQMVEFKVDMYPGRKFHGRVDSLMAGTGSAFALLPPENASGNFVKVVQRIPVKIAIDPAEIAEGKSGHILKVGMSVVPTILTDKVRENRPRQ